MSKETLKLEHLAPYLPYGLMATNKNRTIKTITINGFYYSNNELQLNSLELNGGISVNEIKLILRPLSDLEKEIEVNGEKFVPIEQFQKIFTKRLRFDKDGFYYHVNESYVRNKCDEIFPFNQLEAYSYLFKWHFDVLGLIEKGLAISIHDINN